MKIIFKSDPGWLVLLTIHIVFFAVEFQMRVHLELFYVMHRAFATNMQYFYMILSVATVANFVIVARMMTRFLQRHFGGTCQFTRKHFVCFVFVSIYVKIDWSNLNWLTEFKTKYESQFQVDNPSLLILQRNIQLNSTIQFGSRYKFNCTNSSDASTI